MHEQVGETVFVKHIQSVAEYRNYPYSCLLKSVGDGECLQGADPFTGLWISE